MALGYYEVKVRLLAAGSLKDKRRVVKSIMERLRSRFNLSVAEVADLDRWQWATLGLAVVSADRDHVRRVLDEAVRQMEGADGAEVVEVFRDIQP